jgi:hypothetical protein
VPNPLNPSVTNTDNANSNVIKTSSGITMGFHDGAGSGADKNATGGGANDGLAAQQQYQYQNVHYELKTSSVKSNQNIEVSTPRASSKWSGHTSLQPITQQQQMMADDLKLIGNASTSGATTQQEGKQWALKVPDYNETGGDTTGTDHKDSYLRLGKASDMEITKSKEEGNEHWGKSGWLDYTDGDRVSITQGEKIEYINGGNYSLTIANGALMESDASLMWHDSFTEVGGGVWRRFTVDWTCESHISFGDSEEVFAGAKFEGFVGLATGVTLGGSLSASIGADVEYKNGVDFTFGATVSNDIQDDRLEISTITHQMTAGTRMRINVNPARSAISSASNKASIAAVAALGAAATATVAGVPVILEAAGDRKDIGKTAANSIALGAGYGLATALQVAFVAKGFAAVGSSKADGGEVAELDIKAVPPSLRLGMGAETGPPVPFVSGPGIDITPGSITIGFGPSCQIVMTSAGITFTAPTVDFITTGKLSLTSGGVLDLKSTGALNLKAGAVMDLKSTGPMTFAAPTYPYT